jgi:hypothetical protein
VHVTIINRVLEPPHPANIIVHCKSKNDDLGFHTLKLYNSYMFSFNPNFFDRTLFFCSFTWPGNPHRHYLDIYSAKRNTCTNCTWLININGGCLNAYKPCDTWKSIELMDANNTFM